MVKIKCLIPTEKQDAKVVAQWLDLMQVTWYHTPMEGARNVIVGANLKRMGMKRGVPDICICVARHGFHGLYIEMKRKNLKNKKGGGLSLDQLSWLSRLRLSGYDADVTYGVDETLNRIKHYLGITA